MRKGAFVRPGALLAAGVLAAACIQAVACGGDKSGATEGFDAESTGNPSPESGTNPDDATTVPPSEDGSTVSPPVKAEGGALKAIGSPCSVGTDCVTGTCDTMVPGGMCTKACTADSDCTEKGNSAGAACLNSMCYEFCKEVDASAPVVDGGKTSSPCKNKELICEAVAGQTAPLCMPNPDGGGSSDDAGASEDAGPAQDAATDAPTTD